MLPQLEFDFMMIECRDCKKEVRVTKCNRTKYCEDCQTKNVYTQESFAIMVCGQYNYPIAKLKALGWI